MVQGHEQRKTGRRRTLFGGVIYGPAAESWNCNVADISEEGVKVKCKAWELIEVGSQVDLKINKYNDMRRCEVMWARDGQVGLRFLVSIDTRDENMSELFKLVRNDQ